MVVQWLGLCATTARAQVPFLVEELRFCKPHDEAKKKTKNTTLYTDGNHINTLLGVAFQKTVWQFLKMLNIVTSYYVTLELHSWIYSQEN